jgi:hypothetical protein
MAIKKKDGSVFKLRGPNPLMNGQSVWKGNIKVHNLNWQPEVIEDSHPQVATFETPLKNKMLEELIETKPVEIPIRETRITPKEPEPQLKTTDSALVVMHCLPATVKEHKDLLYGEVRRTVKYGSPFTFEAILVENGDLTLIFWTPLAKVTEGSIVFPQNLEKRWWRVASRQSKNSGYVLTCGPSDYQPAFK